MIASTKACIECGTEKPVDEFHRHSGYRDGRRPVCKTCRVEGHRSVELDMPAGWPGTIKRMVVEVAQEVHAPLESIGYMDGLFSEREDEFRSLFSGRALRALHCTRLLPHEEEWIRNRGLLLLTEQLVTERIERAVDVGAVTRQTADELLRSHVFATREHDNREKQVCFFLSPRVLNDRVGAVWGLVRYWGGEAMSMSSKSLAHRALLETLGRPAVVVVDLDLSASWDTHHTFPGLLRAFVGRYLGERDADADVFYTTDIEPNRIVDIWTPGHADYDRYPELPQEAARRLTDGDSDGN